MTVLQLPGTDLSVAAFCYGVMHFGTKARGRDALELYHLYREAGGNFFDTAHCYACWLPGGDGASERELGACLRHFGDRHEVVISTKGGHFAAGSSYPRPDDCMTPRVIASDITESLERLQIETIDLYVLHRDDLRHPVEENIELLNAEIRRGRIRSIGASNWSIQRLTEANAYAAAAGLQGFVVSSPQWNLARPNHAPIAWNGDYDTTTQMMTGEDIVWHREHVFPVMPWTPTAYGYFAGAAGRNASSFDNVVSRQRRERAMQLAQELGGTPNQIALAYLRAHDFPVIPILGTMNREHLAEALAAEDLSLTPEQRDWLVRDYTDA
jgi:aryl-alcohol dehydrogenase-like predicted oxidoreductase